MPTFDRFPHHRSEIDHARRLLQNHPDGANRSVNEVVHADLSRGDALADQITRQLGSWRFIIIQSATLALWLVVNSIGWYFRWDPYPFILLNLVLSFQAAFTAPVIMMSQNRQAARDRIASELDFEINRVAAQEIDIIQAQLDTLSKHQWDTLLENLQEHQRLLEALHERTHEIEKLILDYRDENPPV